jgi:homoserine O-acetyltransferase
MNQQNSSRPTTENSVGIVTPTSVDIKDPLTLACGQVLSEYHLVYETYGELNSDNSNAILICHALSGNHHAAGYHTDNPNEKPGWWDNCIGPGKPIDTNKFYVVVPNNIGGCHGSTGPASINPETGKIWGPDFPPLRFRDWVDSQVQLSDLLGIQTWAAIVGGSLGGMQAMRWSLEYPDRLKHCLVIASAMNLSPQNIAFNEMARQAILADPDFCEGRYLEQDKAPNTGLALARMIGHVTYLSQSQLKNALGENCALVVLSAATTILYSLRSSLISNIKATSLPKNLMPIPIWSSRACWMYLI